MSAWAAFIGAAVAGMECAASLILALALAYPLRSVIIVIIALFIITGIWLT